MEYAPRFVIGLRRLGSVMLLFGGGIAACRCTPKPEPSPTTTPAVKTSAPTPSSSAETGTTTAALDVDTGCPAALADTRRGGTRPNSYVAPSEAEMKAARAAVAKLLKGDTTVDAASFGFEVVPLDGWGDTVLLREAGEKRRGGGAYVIRKGSTSNLVVMAPHTFYDEGTFPLACEFFQRTKARALYINTVHRYKSAPATPDGKHPGDMAHSPATTFQSATEAAVDVIPKVSVIQLHGFADRKLGARAVVSTGEKRPGSPLVARVARAFEDVVGPRILKYPEDTNELGATTNVQGSIVRRAGGQFLHIEMDDGLRKDLVSDAALRAKALDALGTSITKP